MQTYLFYDIETTGLNKSFDQVLQFAAIRTNLNLEELERHEIRIKLNSDVIPTPQAVITHQIGFQEMDAGISEYDGIKKIHRLLNEPGTISLGYNTLGFDDEFLRFSFYRNLLPPYTHQYANQCNRMDIYSMAVMYFLFKNEVANWPENSLKLEMINEVNQLAKGSSHNAMVDVEVTLALAQLFFKERKMWDYLISYFNKQMDQTRTKDLQEALMIGGGFGSTHAYQASVLCLGIHRHYKNQTVWLRLDNEEFNANSDFKYVIRKKWGEPHFALPKQDRFLRHLSPERQSLAATNKAWLEKETQVYEKIVNQHLDFIYPTYPNTDIQASLYINGFWTKEQEAFCRHFHAASPKEKAIMTEQLNDPSLKTLAMRILGRHFPEVLTVNQKHYFEDYLQETFLETSVDYKGQVRLGPKTALSDIEALKKDEKLNGGQQHLLVELEKFLKKKIRL